MVNTREIAAEYRLAHWARIMQERVQSGVSIIQMTADSTYPPDKLAGLLRALTQPC